MIIPIFLPHRGCPHRCIFCEQERITSQPSASQSLEAVESLLAEVLSRPGLDTSREREIAFYGGTFTGLPGAEMLGYLKTASPYLQQGLVRGIRVSTRPDALDDHRLGLLASHGVRTVELGAQSMDDRVLRLSRRGHDRWDTIHAVNMLKDGGFQTCLQLMPGLPGDSPGVFARTIEAVLDMAVDMVRLYPALVIEGTPLASLYRRGQYRPWRLREALDTCADACLALERAGIRVIRMGLLASPSLVQEGQILAGPWHPAFGFLVRSALYHRGIRKDLPASGESQSISIAARRRDIPLLRGYQNEGLKAIEALTGARVREILPDDRMGPGCIEVQKR